MSVAISDETVICKIHLIRGLRVILDSDLAALYKVETKVLNQAVKRNRKRFPQDFMFQLSMDEFRNLKSQSVTSSWGGRRKCPLAFTEQGVAMLSSVLNSERAILVNIHIIRVFTRLREMLSAHKDILAKLEQLEGKVVKQDDDIRLIFSYLKELLNPQTAGSRTIGFKRKDED